MNNVPNNSTSKNQTAQEATMTNTTTNNSFSPFESQEAHDNFYSQEARASAAENANELLTDAAVCIDALLKHDEHMSTAPKHASLVASHALLSLMDFEGGRIAKALEEIAESVDFLAARPDKKTELKPTADESALIVEALKTDWLNRYPRHTENACRAAVRRFEILAGL